MNCIFVFRNWKFESIDKQSSRVLENRRKYCHKHLKGGKQEVFLYTSLYRLTLTKLLLVLKLKLQEIMVSNCLFVLTGIGEMGKDFRVLNVPFGAQVSVLLLLFILKWLLIYCNT